jgi:hypothetical protein
MGFGTEAVVLADVGLGSERCGDMGAERAPKQQERKEQSVHGCWLRRANDEAVLKVMPWLT